MNNIKQYKNMSDDDYHKFYLENRQVQYEQEAENFVQGEKEKQESFERFINVFVICLFLIIAVFSFIFHINSN